MVLDKLKRLRGIFYRRLAEENKEGEEPLPGFRLERSTRIVELPPIDDITKLSVIYPLMEPFSYANIKWDDQEKTLVYNLIEPELTEGEKKFMEKISEAVIELVDVELTAMKESSQAVQYLQKQEEQQHPPDLHQ
mgnify:CR=1 FL=1